MRKPFGQYLKEQHEQDLEVTVVISWSLNEVSSGDTNSEVLTRKAMALDDAIIKALPAAFAGRVGETGHGDYDTFAVVHGGRETAKVVLSEWGDSDGGDLNVHGTVTSPEIERLIGEIEDMNRDDWGEPAMMFRIAMDFVTVNGVRFDPLQGDEDDFIAALR